MKNSDTSRTTSRTTSWKKNAITYKDADRRWWKIKWEIADIIPEPDLTTFEYHISRDGVKLHTGYISSPFDEPRLDDILLDFQGYINSIIVGFAHDN